MNTRSGESVNVLRALGEEDFNKLKALDSCSVANAIERFQVQLRNEGFTEGGLECRFPEMGPVLGYAMTLKVRSSAPPTKTRVFFESTEWWDMLLTLPTPRILVIQDVDRNARGGGANRRSPRGNLKISRLRCSGYERCRSRRTIDCTHGTPIVLR